MNKKVLIVGGVAGGASVAARLRRLDENTEIIILEKDEYISFANCGLPYYIGGTIKERDKLIVKTPEHMKERFNIDVRTKNEVLSIDKENKIVHIRNHNEESDYTENYDVLVLATGSTPLKPEIKGLEDTDNVFSIWNVQDTDKIKALTEKETVNDAVVIGGGYIGLEMAENLKAAGLNVDVVEKNNHLLPTLDFEMAQVVHKHLDLQEVNLYLNSTVSEFKTVADKTVVVLNDGTELIADLVILSVGTRPNSDLAEKAGLQLNSEKGIVVDDHLLTSDKNIYAVGDVSEVTDIITNEKIMLQQSAPANKQGRICADNIAGIESVYQGSQGVNVSKVFDLTVASTGLSEDDLMSMGKEYQIDYQVAYATPTSHAEHYPDAFPMNMKLLFDNDGKILGAEIVGLDGVDKRIDVIATAIRFGANARDLVNLELAYAPPYSAVKDPVNYLGFVAENILNGLEKALLVREIKDLDMNENIIVDVREPEETALGMIDGAINIPLHSLRDNLDKLDRNKTIIVHCAVGQRAHVGTSILRQNGFNVKNLLGGYKLYETYIHKNAIIKHRVAEKEIKEDMNINPEKLNVLNACGLQCPGPIMQLNNKMKDLKNGEILKVLATDPGFVPDSKAWCEKSGNTFIKHEKEGKAYAVYVGKSDNAGETTITRNQNNSTMVVFSGDMDKAIASLIIANGARAMGKEVTMFYTFWGLNILRKSEKQNVKRGFIEKMFAGMMPRGVDKLQISKMNFGGAGTLMMKYIMRRKNVYTLQKLLDDALASGVKMVACTMSMDIMGITQEELIEGIDYAGVAAYLGATEDANHNLFI